ncbi:MAG: CDP-alcohol phosphatidyltransferase family protein [Longimicrobiales bacterium]
MADQPGEHKRTYDFLLAPLERKLLPRLAAALPPWVTPDHLTLLGLIASTGIGIAYFLSNRNEVWLWLASALLVVNWFGDSLDGTLARFRRIERPRYGFYLDHLMDAYSTFMIGMGLGFSPYMLLAVGLAIVIAYLLLSINVYLETHVFGEFNLGYALIGPTEVRVILILLNTLALEWGPVPFGIRGYGATVFDVAGVLAVASMLGMLAVRATGNLRTLARMEPPGRPRDPE